MRITVILLLSVAVSILGAETLTEPNSSKLTRNLSTRSPTLSPIRILYHYISFDLGTGSANTEFQTEIIKYVDAYFTRALKVNPFVDNLSVGPTFCGPNIPVPFSHQDPGVPNYDLIVYLTTDTRVSSWYDAYSGVCDQEGTFRNEVSVGYIVVNAPNFKALDKNRKFLTVLQEMTRVLGFSTELYPYWKNENGELYPEGTLYKTVNIRGKDKFMIVTPNVVVKAREAFGCSTMEGVELEEYNQIGVSSLWDMRIMFNDYMTGNLQAKPILSTITLALLKDTGWYEVNYDVAQVPVFGRGAGCGFIYEKCVTGGVSYDKGLWCDSQAGYTCDAFGNSKATCNIANGLSVPPEFQYFPGSSTGGDNHFPDFCPFNFPFPAGFCKESSSNAINEPLASEIFGTTSKCFKSTLVKEPYSFSLNYAACYEVISCSTTDATVRVGTSTFSCPFTGKTITLTGYTGSLECPNSNILCRDSPCLNACYGSGKCVNGACQCPDGFSGSDCSIICQSKCAICTSSASCSLCITQHALLNGVCVLNGCSSNCLSCSSITSCTVCAKGFYRASTGACLACNSACTECSSSSICTACVVGRYLTSTKTCAVCSSTCSACETLTKCTDCKTSYFLDSLFKCSACSSNCLKCSSSTFCLACKDGYYVSSSMACVVCPTGCSLCNPDLTCTACKAGYYKTANNKCLVCSSGCIDCVINTECNKCKNGFYLLSTKLCKACLVGCATCDNGATCLTCKSKYFLNTTFTCQGCLSPCVNCSSSTYCLSCVSGLTPVSGSCP